MGDLTAAFLIGLAGSIHCIGMCGGIVGALCMSGKVKNIYLYHIGRIVTYSLLGLTAGLLGQLLSISGLQQGLSILAGAVMVIFGLQLGGWMKERWGALSSLRLPVGLLRQAAEGKSSRATFIVGLFNGLLPCGMVYAALAIALKKNSLEEGTAVMTAFGLGTLPAFTIFTSMLQKLSPKAKGKWLKAAALILILFGIFTLFRKQEKQHNHSPSDKAVNISDITNPQEPYRHH